MADALLALVLSIIYFITFKSAIGNNAGGQTPETVGIFMLAGFVIQCVVLVLPQYGFINIFAIVMYGISLYKETYLIPDFIAGKMNNVEYNGGSFGLNMLYFIMQIIIIVSAVVATFMGFYKNKEDENADFKFKATNANIIKVSVCGLAIVGAVLGGTLSTSAVKRKAEADIQRAKDEAEAQKKKEEEEARIAEEKKKFNPITDEVKAKAEAFEYANDPSTLIVKEKAAEEYDYSSSILASVPYDNSRTDAWLAYYFEGSYSEGYQGDYSPTYCYLYLWNDGTFGGVSGKENVKGYWYNSSLANGKDKNGVDIADCLTMVSNLSHYESINTMPKTGFYQYEAYMYLDMGKVWNQGTNARSIIMNGFKYYPEIDIAINMGVPNDHVYKVGDTFSKNTLKIYRILKDCNFGAIFGASTFTITIPEGMVEDGKLAAAGTYTITATYKTFTTTKTITVI